MKNLVLLLFLTLINSFYISGQEINWMTIEEAELAVKKQPKKILIDVYTDWCGYCKKMDKTTFQDKDMINYLNKEFYCVKMDGEDKNIMTFKGKTKLSNLCVFR
jgi:thioredoxin-related protein